MSSRIAGPRGWLRALSPALIDNLHRYRRYDTFSLRDLLRVFRNKMQHFRELPPALREEMGPLPGGYVAYFTARFPSLLLLCFLFVARDLGADDDAMRGYLDPGAEEWAAAAHDPNGPRGPQPPSPEENLSKDAPRPTATAAVDAVAAASAPPPPPSSPPPKPPVLLDDWAGSFTSLSAPAAALPRRPDRDPCSFFAKTGFCKFGASCRFDHPSHLTVVMNSQGYPMRPGMEPCSFFVKTGECKFGPMCKFHHPEMMITSAN